MLGSGLIVPLVKRFEESFGLSHGEMGTLLGACGAVFSIASVLGGYLDAHLGSRRVLAACTLACAAAALWLGWAWDTTIFVAALLAFSFTNGLTQMVNGTVSRLYGQNRSSGINLLHGFQGLGRLLAPLAVVVAMNLTGTWRVALFISAALHVVWSVLFHLGLPRHQPHPPGHVVHGPIKPLLRSPLLWTAMAAFTVLVGAEFAVMSWVPVFLENEAGLSRDLALTGLTVMMAGYTAARLVIGLRQRHPRPAWIFIMAVVEVAAILLLITLRGDLMLLAMCGVMGLAFGCWWPTLAATLFDAVPFNHGVLTGLCNIASTCGIFIFSSSIGWLGDAVSLRWALLVPCACALVFALLYRILWGLRVQPPPSPA